MLKVAAVASSVVILLSLSQSTLAGEGCCHSKGTKTSLQKIEMGEFSSKEEKLEAYKKVYGDLSYEQLQSALKEKNTVVIDANGTDSYQKIHVTGAVNFNNENELKSALPKDKNVLIIAYCGGPKCAAWTSVADFASKAGYTNIKHYSGGLKEWAEKQSVDMKSM